jgi:hypothetical protein
MTRKRGTATVAPPESAYTPVTETPGWMKQPPPCTPEENEYAHNLVWAILAHEITVEQAQRVLNEIFLGRELEL